MPGTIKAVIFDMDGVLINSEPLWRRAMIKGFGENGLHLTEDDCRKTTGQRLIEVIHFWLKQSQMSPQLASKIEHDIVRDLIEMIQKEGSEMKGVKKLLDTCVEKKLKIGLATSSSVEILDAVLSKLQISKYFEAILSAQNLKYGKPHPEVFINCATILGIETQHCLVIEDSINGIIAAKAAQMRVIAVPDNEHKKVPQFVIADYVCHDLLEAKNTIEKLIQ